MDTSNNPKQLVKLLDYLGDRYVQERERQQAARSGRLPHQTAAVAAKKAADKHPELFDGYGNVTANTEVPPVVAEAIKVEFDAILDTQAEKRRQQLVDTSTSGVPDDAFTLEHIATQWTLGDLNNKVDALVEQRLAAAERENAELKAERNKAFLLAASAHREIADFLEGLTSTEPNE